MIINLDEHAISVGVKGLVVFKFNGVARDYQSIISQMRIFKNLSGIESADVIKISVSDKGHENFEGVLKF